MSSLIKSMSYTSTPTQNNCSPQKSNVLIMLLEIETAALVKESEKILDNDADNDMPSVRGAPQDIYNLKNFWQKCMLEFA